MRILIWHLAFLFWHTRRKYTVEQVQSYEIKLPSQHLKPLSYEIKLPSQAFPDGRFSLWRKLRQVLRWSKVQIGNNRQLRINSQLSTVYKSELCYIIISNQSYALSFYRSKIILEPVNFFGWIQNFWLSPNRFPFWLVILVRFKLDFPVNTNFS